MRNISGDLISVIIPIYNVEKYLKRCINSVVNQTYANLEIILVEDGSPDQCGVICDQFAMEDNRIRVIHQENKGLSGARNSGLDIATGAYIVFIDSDDFIQKNYVEMLYSALIENDADLSQCGIQEVENETDVQHEIKDGLTYKSGKEMLQELYRDKHLAYTVVWNKLYKRELLMDVHFPVGKIHEDEYFTYLIYDRINKAVVLDAELYCYYVDNNSITRSCYTKKRQDIIPAYQERMEYFKEKGYQELYQKTGETLADILIYHEYCTRTFLKDRVRERQLREEFKQLYHEQDALKKASVVKKTYLGLYYYFPKFFGVIFDVYQRKKGKL